jgi:hypothetical protein
VTRRQISARPPVRSTAAGFKDRPIRGALLYPASPDGMPHTIPGRRRRSDAGPGPRDAGGLRVRGAQRRWGSAAIANHLAATADHVAATGNRLAATINRLAATGNNLALIANHLAAMPDRSASGRNRLAARPNRLAATPDRLAAIPNRSAASANSLAAMANRSAVTATHSAAIVDRSAGLGNRVAATCNRADRLLDRSPAIRFDLGLTDILLGLTVAFAARSDDFKRPRGERAAGPTASICPRSGSASFRALRPRPRRPLRPRSRRATG